MRVCVFTTDLGSIGLREDALLRRVAEFSAEPADAELSFVGCRQSSELEPGVAAYQPHVDARSAASLRVANVVFRLVDAGLAPLASAKAGLALCAPRLVEAIRACDPDVVLLDVRWGRYLKAVLDASFPDRVFVIADNHVNKCAYRPAARLDPSAKVSIVLPTHNGSKYLRRSIESCLNQSHNNLELIVVDDGSTEDLRPIVSEFADSRVSYVRHETNRGLPAALNTGFARAVGEYLTWTSDDNFYDPNALDRMARFLQNHPETDFVYAAAYIIDELRTSPMPRIRQPRPPEELPRHNGIGACFLYTRRVYREIGDYDSAAVLVEDYDYWIRVSKRFKMQRMFSPLYYYRYHQNSLTSKHGADDVAIRFNLVKQQNGIA